MVVVTETRGIGNLEFGHPWSRTMIYPPNRDRVAAARAASGGWTQVRTLNGIHGLGALPVLPTWAWIAGGLVAGGAASYAFFKLRKKR